MVLLTTGEVGLLTSRIFSCNPPSTYTPSSATNNPYAFSVSSAKKLLTSHGWTVTPGGTSVCKSAGSGATQCGAGIPAGTKLAWNLVYNATSNPIPQMVTDLVSKAKLIGMNITLKSDNFNHMIATYYNVAAPQNVDKWAMEDFGGFSIATYPTMNGIFNCVGTYNIGSYCDKKADQLIAASTGGTDPAAVKAEADYLTLQQPGLFQPVVDQVVTWKNTISGTPASFASLTQFQLNPEFWYTKK